MTVCISWPERGLYVNEDNHSSYTVQGRTNLGADVELFSSGTLLGTATADQNRDWWVDLNFEQNFSEGAVPLEVKSGSGDVHL